jgi:hypothetical protein
MYQDESFKSINEKVYKLLLSQNDDNRELAETTFVSDEVDTLINDFVKLDGFLLDYMNELSATISNIEATGLTSPFSKYMNRMITLMIQLQKQILSLDINNVSKESFNAINEYKDKYTELLDVIAQGTNRLKEMYAGLENANYEGEPPTEFPNSYDQVILVLSDLVQNINVKLLNFNQNAPVQNDPLIGSGYTFSLFNTSGYQPTQFLRV